MKTFNDFLKDLYKLYEEEKSGKCIRIRSTAHEICTDDRITPRSMDNRYFTADDIDTVHKVLCGECDGYYEYERVKYTANYFIVKSFLEADDNKKEEMINDKYLWECLLSTEKCFNRFIPCDWWKKIMSRTKTKKTILRTLQCVKDFDNPTDEEITYCLNVTDKDSDSAKYDECLLVFGEDRTIPLIIKAVDDVLTRMDLYNLGCNTRYLKEEELLSIYKGLSDESVKKMRLPCTDSRRSLVYKLFDQDPRWLIHMEDHMVDIKSILDKDGRYNMLSDRIKTSVLVAKCCQDRGFPEYILRKIKLFVPMIKMYSFNYKEVFPMMMECFNEDGSFKKEILDQAEALAKGERAEKAKELKYAIIRNGNMMIFKTEEECDAEVKPGDQKIEDTAKNLQKRMLKLLEN